MIIHDLFPPRFRAPQTPACGVTCTLPEFCTLHVHPTLTVLSSRISDTARLCQDLAVHSPSYFWCRKLIMRASRYQCPISPVIMFTTFTWWSYYQPTACTEESPLSNGQVSTHSSSCLASDELLMAISCILSRNGVSC